MKRKNSGIKALSVILIVTLLASYFIYQLVLATKDDMETQFALSETVYKTVDTKCFVIRDEDFVKNSYSGTTVSFARNGERIARNDTVSVIFDSSDDAASYLKISQLEKDILHYEELSGQANFQTLNIDAIDKKIEYEIADFLKSRDSGDFSDAVSKAEVFRDSITGKQIATGNTLEYSEELTRLQSELDSLKSKNYSYKEVKSKHAGYYINGADGYENTIKFTDVDSLKLKDIKKALKSKPQSVADDVVGRVVSSFNWYVACVVPTEDTVNLTLNSTLYVNFPYEGIEKLPMNLYKIGSRDGKETMLILSSDLMNEQLADMRIEDIQIITEEHTGYKINNSAIRTVNGEKGVYVLRGNLIGFRKIHILYTTDEYTIVNNPQGESDYIKLYDKVVTKGVELYDNKLV